MTRTLTFASDFPPFFFLMFMTSFLNNINRRSAPASNTFKSQCNLYKVIFFRVRALSDACFLDVPAKMFALCHFPLCVVLASDRSTCFTARRTDATSAVHTFTTTTAVVLLLINLMSFTRWGRLVQEEKKLRN